MSPKHILALEREEKIEFLNSFDLFLTDCDGVLWCGDNPIEGVGKAIELLKANNKKFGYVTNNSERSDEQYQKLFELSGISFELATLSHPTKNFVEYLKKINFNGLIYCLGANSLKTNLTNSGFNLVDESKHSEEESFSDIIRNIEKEKPVDAVIINGYHGITAVKLVLAQAFLKKNPECLLLTGASDLFIPVNNFKIVGPGVFSNLLVDTSNRVPILLGKPGKELGNIITEKYKTQDTKRVLMVGDMLVQDIGFGKNSGFQTLAVLSGGCKYEDFNKAEYVNVIPDFYANSLADFVDFFKN